MRPFITRYWPYLALAASLAGLCAAWTLPWLAAFTGSLLAAIFLGEYRHHRMRGDCRRRRCESCGHGCPQDGTVLSDDDMRALAGIRTATECRPVAEPVYGRSDGGKP